MQPAWRTELDKDNPDIEVLVAGWRRARVLGKERLLRAILATRHPSLLLLMAAQFPENEWHGFVEALQEVEREYRVLSSREARRWDKRARVIEKLVELEALLRQSPRRFWRIDD